MLLSWAIPRIMLTAEQYYKPWDLRPEEETQIKEQIEETESLIAKELAERKAEISAKTDPEEVHHPLKQSPGLAEESLKAGQTDVHMEEEPKPDLVGDDTTNEQEAAAPKPEPQSTNDVEMNEVQPKSEEKPEDRPHDDHGGEELVEGQEDDVIY